MSRMDECLGKFEQVFANGSKSMRFASEFILFLWLVFGGCGGGLDRCSIGSGGRDWQEVTGCCCVISSVAFVLPRCYTASRACSTIRFGFILAGPMMNRNNIIKL